MSFINYASREINCKIVYYGPGLCGKTTNLQFVYQKTATEAKGKMISLATETERTLFFDFLPLALGEIRGFKTRFHLYTVPGQVFYDASRKLILKGVDGVVFVADSQEERMEANIESVENLRFNLQEQGYDLDKLPYVIQYNKRDLPNIVSVDELRRELATVLNGRVPTFEDLPQLPYARGVFEESLRLYPPAPGVMRAVAKPAELGGYDMPVGSIVFVSIGNIHRHPDFWEEPSVFRPERFLREGRNNEHRLAFMPFGAGPRVCVGNHFAMMEGILLLALIAQRFDLKCLTDRPVETVLSVTQKPRDGLMMRLYRRI